MKVTTKFNPKIYEIMSGYNTERLVKDLGAGMTVAIVALISRAVTQVVILRASKAVTVVHMVADAIDQILVVSIRAVIVQTVAHLVVTTEAIEAVSAAHSAVVAKDFNY